MNLHTSPTVASRLMLAPGARLALDVLQMPLLQLHAYLHQQIEENPLLEIVEGPPPAAASDAGRLPSDECSDDAEHETAWSETDDAPAEELGSQSSLPAPPGSLVDHLLFQVRCATEDHLTREMAEMLVGWLDADGYLRVSLEEIAPAEGADTDSLARALDLIHRLDPPGIGARSIAECLLIQLAQAGAADSLAARIVRDHFDLLAKRHWEQLAARLHVSLAKIQAAYQTIAQLEPKPARNFGADAAPPLIPDLVLHRTAEGWRVELNEEHLPRVGLNRSYRALGRGPGAAPDAREFIRQQSRHAVWLLRALRQRRATLLAIARALVELERDFFEQGISRLRALTQEELAQRIGCHPSTVSRGMAGKTMQTPFGMLPLATFFGGSFATDGDPGHRLSRRTIQEELTGLVAGEDRSAPLRDEQLVAQLRARGYPVARRTVAKYRARLQILPAHLRRAAC